MAARFSCVFSDQVILSFPLPLTILLSMGGQNKFFQIIGTGGHYFKEVQS